MVRKLEIDLDEATHARLVQEAARTGQTPETLMSQIASRRYSVDRPNPPEDPLLKYIGCISSGDPLSSNNERIDEDLAREFGNEIDQ